MKKLFAVFSIAFVSLLALAIPAQAHNPGGGNPSADNKSVTFCHATGSDSNPYVKLTTSVMAFYKAGHVNHGGDIWEAFSYTTVGGQVVNVPAQGDTSLLAFDNCQKPQVDEKVAKPDVIYNDVCGTKDDVFSVAPGRGYTVGAVSVSGDTQSITATLDKGFAWTDGTKDDFVATRPVFTNVDCGLPDTGGSATYARGAGIAALAGLLGVGMITFLSSRRRTN